MGLGPSKEKIKRILEKSCNENKNLSEQTKLKIEYCKSLTVNEAGTNGDSSFASENDSMDSDSSRSLGETSSYIDVSNVEGQNITSRSSAVSRSKEFPYIGVGTLTVKFSQSNNESCKTCFIIDSNVIETANGYPVDLATTATGNTVTYNYLKGKEGSGDDGVNNSKSNTVHDNYASTFDNIEMKDVVAEYNSKFTVSVSTQSAANGAVVQFRLGDLIIGNATVNNKKASLTYDLNKNYAVGNYTLTALLTKAGFKSKDITANLEITKATPTVKVNDVTAKDGQTVPFTATLTDSSKNPLSGVEVKFYRNANYIGAATTDENGIATLNAKIPTGLKGTFTILATVSESGNYKQASGEAKLTVTDSAKTYTKINAKDINMYFKDGTRLEATITDLEGNPLSGLDVVFNINNVDYTRTSDEKGQVSIGLGLVAGKYVASFNFKGNSKYLASSAAVNVTIKNTLFANDIVKMFKNATRFYAGVKKDNKPVSNVALTLNINGVLYHRTTDLVGTSSIAINLDPGTYVVTVMTMVKQ